MINKVTTKWLKTWNACEDELELGIKWFKKQSTSDPAELIEILIKEERWDWVYKCFENLITKEQAVDWAICCVKEVLEIFEKEFPKDKRPREAIEAAEKWLKNPTDAAEGAARAAAWAARAAWAAAGDATRKKCALYMLNELKNHT